MRVLSNLTFATLRRGHFECLSVCCPRSRLFSDICDLAVWFCDIKSAMRASARVQTAKTRDVRFCALIVVCIHTLRAQATLRRFKRQLGGNR